MFADLARLRTRLAAVDPLLIPPKDIEAAWRSGSERFVSEPLTLPVAAVQASRHNPVLGAALGLGAVEAAALQEDPLQRAEAGLALGIALTWWGSFAEALSCLQQSIPILSQGLPTQAVLYAHWHRLISERRLSGRIDAVQALLETAERLEQLGDGLGAHRCRLDTAAALALTQHERAMHIIEAARTYFQARGLTPDDGIALAIQAHVHINQSEFDQAHDELNRAEAIFIQFDMPAMLCFTWMERGVSHRHQLQVEKALHWLEAARERAESLQHDFYQIVSLTEIAALLFYRGDAERSMAIHRTIQQIASANDLIGVVADSELTTANWLLGRGEYEAAAEGYRRARDLYEAFGNRRYVAICSMNLGVVARRQGHFSESLQLLNESSDLFERAGLAEDQVHVPYNLGKTYAAFGYFEPALEHIRKSIEIAEQAGIPLQSIRPKIDLARLLMERGEADSAHHLLEQAASQAEAAGLHLDRALCRLAHADLHLKTGRVDLALAGYRQSRAQFEALNRRAGIWEAQLGIAATHAAQRQTAAAREALQELPADALPATLGWHYHALAGQVARQEGKAQEALDAYMKALLQVRKARRGLEEEEQIEQSMLSLRPLYEEAASLAEAEGDPSLVLAVAELYGAQLLSVRLGYPVVDSDTLNVVELPATLSQLLTSRLGREWTVLRYVWHGDALWVFALTPEGLEQYPVTLNAETRMDLRACASPDDSFRRAAYLHQGQTGMGRESRRRLFECLFPRPVRDRLSPAHMLVIVPSQQLHGLAFQALLDGDAPLIERSCVLYAQSLDLLRQLLASAPEPPPSGRGLILFQSRFDHPGYGPLPHIEREADAVTRASQTEVQRLPLADLTPEALQAAGESGDFAAYDWLHIATHIHADPATGTFTGLLIGKGALGLRDIRRWRLTSRLVALSACQTGLARWYYGDEIAGLRQAFLGAGAQTVVASLWLATDTHIAELMAEFYARLAQGAGPAAALARAQRAAHCSGLEAYSWAPFSAFGLP